MQIDECLQSLEWALHVTAGSELLDVVDTVTPVRLSAYSTKQVTADRDSAQEGQFEFL